MTLSTLGSAAAVALLVQGEYDYGLAFLAGSMVFGASGRHHWTMVHRYADDLDFTLRKHLVSLSERSAGDSTEIAVSLNADGLGYEVVDPAAFAEELGEISPPNWMKSSHNRLAMAVDVYAGASNISPSVARDGSSLRSKRAAVVEAATELAVRLETA